MAYSFDKANADAPSQQKTRNFEMFGVQLSRTRTNRQRQTRPRVYHPRPSNTANNAAISGYVQVFRPP
jgi:hypothetical protein